MNILMMQKEISENIYLNNYRFDGFTITNLFVI